MNIFLRDVPDETKESVLDGIKRLTPRERQVLELVLDAQSNKEAARALNISPRTVEVYRGRVMDKLGVRSAIEIARIVTVLSNQIGVGELASV